MTSLRELINVNKQPTPQTAVLLASALLMGCDGNTSNLPGISNLRLAWTSNSLSKNVSSGHQSESTNVFEQPVLKSILDGRTTTNFSGWSHLVPGTPLTQDSIRLDIELQTVLKTVKTVTQIQPQLNELCSAIQTDNTCSLNLHDLETLDFARVNNDDLDNATNTDAREIHRVFHFHLDENYKPAQESTQTLHRWNARLAELYSGAKKGLIQPTIFHQQMSSTPYDFQFTSVFELTDTVVTQSLNWNKQLPHIQLTTDARSAVSEYNSTFIYIDGEELLLKESASTDSESYSKKQKLLISNNAENNASLEIQSHWDTPVYNGKQSIKVVTSDKGGNASTITTLAADGTQYKIRSNQDFDQQGNLLRSSYCDSSSGVDCSQLSNWINRDISSNQ